MQIQMIENCHGSSRSFAVSKLHNPGSPSVVVVPNHCDLDAVAEELSFYTGVNLDAVAVFPDLETLPYDTETPSSHILNRRAKVFAALASEKKPEIIVTNVNAIMMFVSGASHWLDTYIRLNVGDAIDVSKLEEDLQFIGYQREPMVTWPGQFCVHPNVIDINSIGPSGPARLRIEGGVIKSISVFDTNTQRSSVAVGSIVCMPVREVSASKDAVVCFRTRWRDIFEVGYGQPVYDAVSKGEFPAGIEYYLPLFDEQEHSLFTYLPKDIDLFVFDGAYDEIDKHWKAINKRYQDVQMDKKRYVLSPDLVWMTAERTHEMLNSYRAFYVSDVALANSHSSFDCFPSGYSRQADIKQTVQMLKQWDIQAPKILVTLSSSTKKSQIKALALMAGRQFTEIESWNDVFELKNTKPTISVVTANIDEGFFDAKSGLLVITEKEIFGYSVVEKKWRQRIG